MGLSFSISEDKIKQEMQKYIDLGWSIDDAESEARYQIIKREKQS